MQGQTIKGLLCLARVAELDVVQRDALLWRAPAGSHCSLAGAGTLTGSQILFQAVERSNIALDSGQAGIDLLEGGQQLEAGQGVDGEDRENFPQIAVVGRQQIEYQENDGAKGQQLHGVARYL